MTRKLALIALVAAALGACDNNDQTIVAGEAYDPQANVANDIQDIELPPSIVATHTYRCKDNSVATVEWLSNDTARVKTGDAEAIAATRGEDGSYSAEGVSLSGAAADSSVTLNGQACRR